MFVFFFTLLCIGFLVRFGRRRFQVSKVETEEVLKFRVLDKLLNVAPCKRMTAGCPHGVNEIFQQRNVADPIFDLVIFFCLIFIYLFFFFLLTGSENFVCELISRHGDLFCV